jgi:hypothetical protein
MTQDPGWRADSSGQRHERYFDPASGLIPLGCGECAESYGDPGADAVAQRSRGGSISAGQLGSVLMELKVFLASLPEESYELWEGNG